MAEERAVFHNHQDSHTCTKRLNATGKSVQYEQAAQPPKQPHCPECQSIMVYKDGWRQTTEGQVQRFICRHCGHRFSEKKPLQKQPRRHIYSSIGSQSISQVCELLTEDSKNLAEITRQEQASREGTAIAENANGKILEYAWWLKKKGRSEATITSRIRRLKGLAKLCSLVDPEAVKETLAILPHKNSTKAITTSAYGDFLKSQGMKWDAPEYKIEQSIPFIPLESEIDQLIAGCSKRTATLLQLLKETGVRIGEAARMTWIDFDSERRTVKVQAEKGSNPRMFSISPKLTGMLNTLPKRNDIIFSKYTSYLRTTFSYQRARTADKLNNPRIRKITFHTLRHWKGTMEYHKTQDPWHVKKILGHKSLKSTEVYINIEQAMFETSSDDYHVKVAHDLKEACQLVETGFEYVTEMEGSKIFRKRK
jgi:integrase/recombinase XerD